jgi:hypothetical protein
MIHRRAGNKFVEDGSGQEFEIFEVQKENK